MARNWAPFERVERVVGEVVAESKPNVAAWPSPSDMSLDGRVAVVTGAARGIGRSTALALARFGAHVVIVDKLTDELDATAELVRSLSRTCVSIPGDVRDDDVVCATRDAVNDTFGRLDILVNNAGGGFWSPSGNISARGEAALIAENFTQVTNNIRLLSPLMDRGGSIVNVTSVEAHRAGPGFSIYAAMKAGVENLSKTLALELAPNAIRVNCIAPDMIPTPGDAELVDASGAMVDDAYLPTPLGHVGSADDAAAVVVFLASELSRFITGATIHLDGGTFAASGWRRRASDDAWLL